MTRNQAETCILFFELNNLFYLQTHEKQITQLNKPICVLEVAKISLKKNQLETPNISKPRSIFLGNLNINNNHRQTLFIKWNI
jgi:hypothetical protein